MLGFTFKENVADVRNTKVFDLVQTLSAHGVEVDVTDPLAHPVEVAAEYGLQLTEPAEGAYDTLIVAVAHQAYHNLTAAEVNRWAKPDALLADVKGIFRKRQSEFPLVYWTL